jgi:hypothetical protein
MIEQLWYEISPFVYAPTGLFVMLDNDSLLADFSGALLLTAALIIVRLRWKHRTQVR